MTGRDSDRPTARHGSLPLVVAAGLLAVAGWACGGSNGQSTTSTTPTTPSTGPAVGLSPASFTFTSATSDPQTVTLTNTGTEVLVIASLVATGNFTETDNCVGSVDVGATCTVTVTFTPTSPGSSGVVTITDNAASSPQTIALTGPNLTSPSAVLSPTSLTFASQAIGTTSSARTVTLTNPVNGLSAPLTISSISAVGDFAIAQNTCGRLLAAGGKLYDQRHIHADCGGHAHGPAGVLRQRAEPPAGRHAERHGAVVRFLTDQL